MQADIGGPPEPPLHDPGGCQTCRRFGLRAAGFAHRHGECIRNSVVAGNEPDFHRTGQGQVRVVIEQVPNDGGATAPGTTDEDRPLRVTHTYKYRPVPDVA